MNTSSLFLRSGLGLLTAGCVFMAGRLSVPASQPASAASHLSELVKVGSLNKSIITLSAEKSEIGKGINEAQIKTALEHRGSISSESSLDDLLKTVLRWAALNPVGALDYVRQHVPKARQNEMVSAVLKTWTAQNPKAAWNWVCINTPDNGQQANAVLSEIGKSNANMAWNFATEFAKNRPSADQSIYVSALQGILYAGDFAKASSLVAAAQLPASQASDLNSLVASQWASYEPTTAAAWVMTLPEGSLRDQALISLGQSWSSVDPQGAANFAAGLPSGTLRTQVVTQALNNWVDQDPVKAGEWLNQFPASPDFDQAISKLSTVPAVIQDVNAALGWAGAITDQQLRTESQARIIVNWMDRDKVAAHNYLQNSTDLPLETRNDILSRIDKGTLEK